MPELFLGCLNGLTMALTWVCFIVWRQWVKVRAVQTIGQALAIQWRELKAGMRGESLILGQ